MDFTQLNSNIESNSNNHLHQELIQTKFNMDTDLYLDYSETIVPVQWTTGRRNAGK